MRFICFILPCRQRRGAPGRRRRSTSYSSLACSHKRLRCLDHIPQLWPEACRLLGLSASVSAVCAAGTHRCSEAQARQHVVQQLGLRITPYEASFAGSVLQL